MLDYVVWLDSEKAHIYALKTTGVEKINVTKGGVSHHTQNSKDSHTDPHLENFFRDLVQNLKEADQLLIMGPGLAKNHFKTFLETHHQTHLAKKIIGIENSDHPTENQIFAMSRTFFKNYNLFNNPI